MNIEISKKLKKLAEQLKQQSLRDMMSPERAEDYSVKTDSIYFNYARNPLNNEALELLLELAEKSNIKQKIDAMFSGEIINKSENRAVKHWLLRAPLNSADDDSKNVHTVLDKMEAFVKTISNGALLDKPVTDLFCVGVGGSELGSRVVYEALTMGRKKNINVHFVANIDGMAIADAVVNCNAENTLFLMISKTFTTFETTKNFTTIKKWFCAQDGLNEQQFWRQSCAITANVDEALSAGFPESQIFTIWDWVGGRYSLWSSVGLPIALACGMDSFKELLAGAHAMDEHFRNREYKHNLPVMLGLVHTWYSNFLDYPTRCVVPYAQNLKSFPEHLQQLEMESLGKSVDESACPVQGITCPIVWGSVGSNAQHAFFQLFHQGTHIVPIDFIAAEKPCVGIPQELQAELQQHHTVLLANCLAQSESLKNGGDTRDDAYGHFTGNRPSNLLLLDKITPYSIGQLIAAYEHKVLVQSALWGINAFDQFGVELGKKMCSEILNSLDGELDINAIARSFGTSSL